ncbi:MAG TPA: NUDIX hydrolase [Abditibacteriaceae bacterium]|nr:NUDIX hydrolase [Abditibacteriaceae bacterium]
MHRKRLLDQLCAHQPYDAREAAKLQELREFVEANAGCFDRSLRAGHITGSAWILDLERTHVLLTHHLKLERWLQLGGHADGNPDVLQVALSEAKEESGLLEVSPISEAIFDVDVHLIPARGPEPCHLHYDVRFLLQADRNHPLTVTHESKALAWVKLTAVENLNAEASLLRMVAKTIESTAIESTANVRRP